MCENVNTKRFRRNMLHRCTVFFTLSSLAGSSSYKIVSTLCNNDMPIVENFRGVKLSRFAIFQDFHSCRVLACLAIPFPIHTKKRPST